jgi:hypothetical protein
VCTSSFYISRDVMHHDASFHGILASRVIVSYNQGPRGISDFGLCQKAR